MEYRLRSWVSWSFFAKQQSSSCEHFLNYLMIVVFSVYIPWIKYCWRSRDELIRDVLLWTPTHGRAKAERPARTYIQQLCEDTRCCPEDLPSAMNDREEWRERVRNIRATSATWWWWLLLYNSSILDIEHSPYCIALALTHTHKVI